jgi:hypothetical protein
VEGIDDRGRQAPLALAFILIGANQRAEVIGALQHLAELALGHVSLPA